MKKSDIQELLRIISTTSSIKASRFGVHVYEHNTNGTYRACPEGFVVNAVYEKLHKIGWRITAEAHQGGVWGLFDKKDKMPPDSSKNRYDLALWRSNNKPVAVCEFKWAFSQSGFRKDAENVHLAGQSLGLHPLLCLIAVKPQKADLDGVLAQEEAFLKSEYGIYAKKRSHIYKTSRYFCGAKCEDKVSYVQTLALCLKS